MSLDRTAGSGLFYLLVGIHVVANRRVRSTQPLDASLLKGCRNETNDTTLYASLDSCNKRDC